MFFNYNYNLIEKVSKPESKVIFTIRVMNSFFITEDEKFKQWNIFFEKLQEEIKNQLKCEIFKYNNYTFFIITKDNIEEHIFHSLQEIGNKISSIYLILYIGYDYIKKTDIASNSITKSLIANYFALVKNRSVISYEECLEEIKGFNKEIEVLKILNSSIIENKLEVAFQPVINIADKKIIFYEILLRIERQNNIINFINAAEKTDMILDIDEYMIHNTIKNIQDNNVSISVNVSEKSLNNNKWSNKILNVLKDLQSTSANILIEIPVKTILKPNKAVLDTIFKFKSIGCKIIIDDFGMDFCLPYIELEKLPVDFIKISSFFSQDSTKNNELFLQTVFKIAQNLNIKVIAKHIHNQEIFNTLKEYTNYMQGNYFHSADRLILNK